MKPTRLDVKLSKHPSDGQSSCSSKQYKRSDIISGNAHLSRRNPWWHLPVSLCCDPSFLVWRDDYNSIQMFSPLSWIDKASMDHLGSDVLLLCISAPAPQQDSSMSLLFSAWDQFCLLWYFYTLWIRFWVFQGLKITLGHWHGGNMFSPDNACMTQFLSFTCAFLRKTYFLRGQISAHIQLIVKEWNNGCINLFWLFTLRN